MYGKKIITHINQKIAHVNEDIKSEELDSNNEMQTLSEYNIKGEENTSSTDKNKEKTQDGYVRIYECGKIFFISTFESVCAEQETTIRKMKEIMDMYKYYIEEIHAINLDIR